ncbi:MAG: diguanylate cyclase [Lysobacter sp.]|nr:diguanylate cyclase [Lysobacter sp.]
MNQIKTRRLTQELDDTYRRALTGGAFYAAAWLAVGIYGGAFSRAPMLSWSLLLAFVGLAVARFVHRPVHAADDATRSRWLRLHWGIVAATTALWGGVFCWAVLDPAFGPARTAALLSTLGLATAVAHAFSMRRGFAFTCIGFLYLPGLFLLWRNPVDRATAIIMSVYLVYVVISLLRSHVEYQQRLDLDQELRDQRDLFSQQSKLDPLTDLANRRHFADVLADATMHSKRTGAPLTLLLLDLDHFKTINDTHGHVVGDACLVAVARRLRTSFGGEGDLIARVGGEEFGVVLAGQDLATAMLRAERFREDLVTHPIALKDIVLAMTASIGVAEFDSTIHRDDDELYRVADSAVYRAKAAGRNRVWREEAPLAQEPAEGMRPQSDELVQPK